MTYTKDVREEILKRISRGETPKQISKEKGGKPREGTIKNWMKAELEQPENAVLEVPPKTQNSARMEWRQKDYNEEQIEGGKKKKEILNKKYEDIRGYKLDNIECIESYAREKYHGESLEGKLHLEIYQLNGSARTKKIGHEKTQLKLTSQDHIFPDARISEALKGDSYEPKNVREGNASINGYINAKIDPVFKEGEKTISHETAEMLLKHNLKESVSLKDHVSFKYWEDRIVTSNMVAKLPQSPRGSFEAPELGILDGYKNPVSLKAYSMPLYKIDSPAGILDIARVPNKLANKAAARNNKSIAEERKDTPPEKKTILPAPINEMDDLIEGFSKIALNNGEDTTITHLSGQLAEMTWDE